MIFNTLEIVIAPKNDKVECFEIIGNLKISSPIVLMGKPRNQISLSLKDQIFKDKSLTFLFLIFSLTFVLKKCNEHALSVILTKDVFFVSNHILIREKNYKGIYMKKLICFIVKNFEKI